jgi:glycosyltransferase involved in cell wall biosynthesis
MDCSVILCTRNRAARLSEALTSLTRVNIPEGTTWELVVVDNGSTDSTAEVIRSFEGALPIRRVWQPEAGISNARNAGVDAAQGKYFVWMDDDVHVEPNWLAAFLEAFQRWPDAALFGGRITLVLQPPTPPWFLDAFDHLKKRLAARDFGPDPIPLSIANDRIPYGACFAIRAAEQRLYRYDPKLGRAPGQNRSCEETEVVESLLKTNHSGWWVPAAGVDHIIPASRQTLEALINLYEGVGEDWAHLMLRDRKFPSRIPPLALLWAKLPLCYLRFGWAYVTRSKSWPHYFGRLVWYRGVFNYCFGVPLLPLPPAVPDESPKGYRGRGRGAEW